MCFPMFPPFPDSPAAGFDERDPTVVAILRQADRVVRGYFKGQWLIPAPKDAIKFNKVGV